MRIAKQVTICLDDETRKKIDDYAHARHISRSVMIRLLLNEILLSKEKQGGVTQL